MKLKSSNNATKTIAHESNKCVEVNNGTRIKNKTKGSKDKK